MSGTQTWKKTSYSCLKPDLRHKLIGLCQQIASGNNYSGSGAEYIVNVKISTFQDKINNIIIGQCLNLI